MMKCDDEGMVYYTVRVYSISMRFLPIANPVGRFRSTEVEYVEEAPDAGLHLYNDKTARILSENDSPDIGFRWSLNPYRGCMHACAYCYARPFHEYLGFGAGTDFDRRIVLKRDAAALLRSTFDKRSWTGELITFSGATDCYQPIEATYRLTQACLQVCREYKNPVRIITKSQIIERDLDLLVDLAQHTSVRISISIPFIDEEKARAIEPYVPTPARRFRTIERLVAAGLDVAVSVAPLIPGLSDEEVPRILAAAHRAGARRAHMALLRLPGSVKEVFTERIRAAFPMRAEKILSRIRDTRGGALNDPRFGSRREGTGDFAELLHQVFHQYATRLGMNVGEPPADEVAKSFCRPTDKGGQLRLFDAPRS